MSKCVQADIRWNYDANQNYPGSYIAISLRIFTSVSDTISLSMVVRCNKPKKRYKRVKRLNSVQDGGFLGALLGGIGKNLIGGLAMIIPTTITTKLQYSSNKDNKLH